MPRSFALGEKFEKLIDLQIKAGYYNNASEVVRDALRLLEDVTYERESNVKELKKLIAQRRKTTKRLIPIDEVFERLEKRFDGSSRRK